MCVCILYKHRDPKLLPEFFDRFVLQGDGEGILSLSPWAWRHRSRQAAHLGDSALYRLGTWCYFFIQSSWNAEESNT